MLPTPAIRLPVTLPAPTGFGLFLAKLGGLAGLWAALWAILAASTALEHPRYPVAGRIHCDGRPAAGARVRLYPLDREPKLARATAWGTVADDGTFAVKTLGWADGAPAGNYAVTVAYQPPVVTGEDYRPGPQVVAAELTDPHSTLLAIEVLPEPNELGLLSLETPRAKEPLEMSHRWSALSSSHLSQGER
jgi:hypothetical protein